MKSLLVTMMLNVVAAGLTWAGVVIQSTEKEVGSGPATGSETMYVQGGMVRVDTLDARGHVKNSTLFRDGAIWQIDTASRTYTKLDKVSMQQVAGKQRQAIEQLKARMATMPPEQRKMMEKTLNDMQGKGAPSATGHGNPAWSDTGRTEKVASLSCRVWESKVGATTMAQYCIVPPGNIAGGAEAYAAIKKMMTTLKDITADLPMAGNEIDVLASGIQKLDGYPALVREFSDGKPSSERVYKSSSQATLPADKFEIPKGFKAKAVFDEDDE